MKAIILAAGYGTRLGEFGEETPKGLITGSDGKTLLDRVLAEIFSLHEFPTAENVLVVSNNRFFDQYQDFLQKNYPAVELLNDGSSTPEERLGALGDLALALNSKNWWNDDLLVLPSDTYFEFKLSQLVRLAKEKPGLVTIVRDLKDKSLIENRLGCAVLRGTEIAEFVEKPTEAPSSYAAIPFYFYNADIVPKIKDYIAAGGSTDTPGSIIPWFLQEGISVHALKIDSETLDVGTLPDVEKLQSG